MNSSGITAVSFDGTKISYSLRGSAEKADVLTGGAWLRAPAEIADAIDKSSLRAVLMDHRGMGKSDKPSDIGAYSIPAWSKDIISVLDAVGAERAPIVAYSHTAMAAVELARANPERVSALVFIEPALFIDKTMLSERAQLALSGKSEEAVRHMLRYAAPSLHGQDLSRMVQQILGNYTSPVALAGEWLARANYNVDEATLKDINAPALIIGGTRSNIRGDIMLAANALPNCSLWWIRGATHLCVYERPSEVVNVVQMFLGSL
ncbi:uncharacterized protein SOCEGT47_074730 [Sorangium cellulosum]|uniref:AB hydrolase-1 domain-containing protein n=1 Tax=Sorangium cellulosum TaxID=56 RepID=A0A4P2QCQ4_SORCE|nr:alpha/beta hydrolase [Sorangium cellulosum]AUX26903.1 uncharacterized protein SOCEGT47_074730 [Sorangium cellulosum]